MIWIIEGRAVDGRGNGTLWRWRSPASGQLPNREERHALEAIMAADFREVFGRNAAIVHTAVLPRCGEKPWKIPCWRDDAQSPQARWGINVEDDVDEVAEKEGL